MPFFSKFHLFQLKVMPIIKGNQCDLALTNRYFLTFLCKWPELYINYLSIKSAFHDLSTFSKKPGSVFEAYYSSSENHTP